MMAHKTYKELRNSFSSEAKARITEGANSIRTTLDILERVRSLTGISLENLSEPLDTRQLPIAGLEQKENLSLEQLVGMIVTLGGSVDLTINFPGKQKVHVAGVEKLLAERVSSK